MKIAFFWKLKNQLTTKVQQRLTDFSVFKKKDLCCMMTALYIVVPTIRNVLVDCIYCKNKNKVFNL